jgi:hypothetical protein
MKVAALTMTLIAALMIMPAIAQNDGNQPARKQYIDAAISQGIFQKVIVPADLPQVWVTPLFNSVAFELKQNLVAMVYQYYRLGEKPNLALVIVKDSKTGKQIGKYTPAGGLDLD